MERNALMMPEGSDPYYGQQYMPSAGMSSYTPTIRDRLRSWWVGDRTPGPMENRLISGVTGSDGPGDAGIGLLDFIPGLGTAAQVQEAYRAGDDRNLAMAMMPGAKPKGIRAYHGSPHDFDKFDMSKIGTGEGAQAYGHGLYFAESEGVARSYRENLSGVGKWGNYVPPEPNSIAQRLSNLFDNDGSNWKKNGRYIDEIAQRLAGRPKQEDGLQVYTFNDGSSLRVAEGGWDVTGKDRPGRMYEVRIDADPADFLDWDKPLSQQSEKVRGAMNRLANGEVLSNDTGEQAYRSAAMQMGSRKFLEDPELSARVRDAGIPGIKYLDQGSRTSGEGTRNYVLFRDDIIDIVRKYGIAAAASMYGMDAVMQATGERNALYPVTD